MPCTNWCQVLDARIQWHYYYTARNAVPEYIMKYYASFTMADTISITGRARLMSFLYQSRDVIVASNLCQL